MIAILKINSADIINEQQSDTLALSIIPSNSIKYKLSQLPIMKELINQLVDVIEEPAPIDPADYIYIDDVPEFFWKFIQYALSKPGNISPENYLSLLQLLQAQDARISSNYVHMYNWANNNCTLLNVCGIGLILNEKKFYRTAGTKILSENTFNPRENNITISAVTRIYYTSEVNNIVTYLPVENPHNPNKWFRFIKTGYKNLQLACKVGTVTANTFTLNLDLSFKNGDPSSMTSNPMTLTAISKPNTSTNKVNMTLRARYYTNTNGAILTESATGTGNISALPELVQENIGNYDCYKATVAGMTSYTAIYGIYRFKSTIENISTQEKTEITYIDYDKSKIIDDKLLMIV